MTHDSCLTVVGWQAAIERVGKLLADEPSHDMGILQ